MRRRPTDRVLRRWLNTGRPARVGAAIETEALVVERLEAMTALRAAHTEAIGELMTPPAGFHDRAVEGVRNRIDHYGTVAVVADLLGLGFHVGQAMLAPDDSTDDTDQDTNET